MTSRISTELFEHPLAASTGESAANVNGFADLVPLIERDVLTERDRDADPVREVSPIDTASVFVPDHYEPNYAYPLLVWLDRSPPAPGRLERRMRQISDRNYFGVSMVVVGGDEPLEDRLCETFLRLRKQFHLNTERVYLLGSGMTGTQALVTGLNRPGWFAGIAALSADWPDVPRLLSQYDELRGKCVLLGIREVDSAALLADVAYGARLLWTAGVNVTTLTTTAAGELDRSLLREIDRWVMQGIEQPELVC